jgi:hypothetical protein
VNTLRIPLENVLIRENIPAGMNFLLLGALAYKLRSSRADLEPIVVRLVYPNSGLPLYEILDGRHRFIAAVIAGRMDVLATFETDDHE